MQPFKINRQFTGHKGSVYALAPAANPSQFYSAGSDRIVALWNINDQEDGQLIAKTNDVIYSLCYIPETNKLFIGQGKGEVHIVNLATNQEERLIQLFSSPIFEIKYLKEYQQLFVLSGDGECCILNGNDFSLIKRIKISSGKLRSIGFNNDQNIAVIGCGEGYIQLLSIPDLILLERIQIHEPGFSVNAVCFSHDKKYLLTGSRDAHLKILDALTMKVLDSIPAHNYAIYDIAYHESGDYFATASRDKTVKIWDSNSFDVLQRLENTEKEGHRHSINKLLWLQGSDILLSAGDDRSILSWELQKAALL